MNNLPLVSVFIVTYNSEDYIIETLDSIAAQSYQNIELIVSDDGSLDSTISKTKDWISKNDARFVRTEVITVPKNTGVSANYNRALDACKGTWIKNVDGDDLITPTCVEANIKYVLSHPEIEVLFSDMEIFLQSQDNVIGKFSDRDFKEFFDLSAQEQYKVLIQHNILPSPPLFIKAEVIKKYGYNENYAGLEDFPMWVTLTRNGHKAYYFSEVTAKYRKGDSVTRSNKRLYSPFYMNSLEKFYWTELHDELTNHSLDEANNCYMKQFMLYQLAMTVFKNKKSFITRALFMTMRKLLKCE